MQGQQKDNTWDMILITDLYYNLFIINYLTVILYTLLRTKDNEDNENAKVLPTRMRLRE